MSNRAQLEDSPQPLNTRRSTINYDKEIYQADYWQRKVETLMKDKKNILKVTEESHREIRKANEENQNLMHQLKEKNRYIEQLQIEEAIYLRRGCYSQLEKSPPHSMLGHPYKEDKARNSIIK